MNLTRLKAPLYLPTLLFFAAALLTSFSATALANKPDGTQYVSREELALKLASETGISASEINDILKDATFRPNIIRSMNHQWESKPYVEYRPRFLKQSMQEKGDLFIKKNGPILTTTEKKYGVDAHIVAAIIGVETKFGRVHGGQPILDSLYTLSTGFPRRAPFFQKQLAAIIEISRKDQLDLKTLKGSYAGAFGTVQFIPTSFRDYAVDEDGDGTRDLFNSQQDIIGSVANYFYKHHWQHGRPSAWWLPTKTKLTNGWAKRARGKLKHWVTLKELRESMPSIFNKVPAPWKDSDEVSIIEMRTKHGQQFALVHYNFRVIMRYNPSYNYAMAVTEVAALLGGETFAVD